MWSPNRGRWADDGRGDLRTPFSVGLLEITGCRYAVRGATRWRTVVHRLAVGHHDCPQSRSVGSVPEAITDHGDDVTGLQGLLVPSAGRHELRARATDLPAFDGPVLLDIERDHHVGIGP